MIPGLISGALAGYVAAKLTDGQGKGCLLNLLIGWLGGILGDWLFSNAGMTWHIAHPWIGAVLGAVILLLLYNLISGHRHSDDDDWGGGHRGRQRSYGQDRGPDINYGRPKNDSSIDEQ